MIGRRRVRPERVSLGLAVLTSVVVAACEGGGRPAEPRHYVSAVNLELPRSEGFSEDKTVTPPEGDAGGTALRLMREGSVPGAPRIEVVLGEKTDRPTTLEAHLDKSLRQMAALEDGGQVRITEVDQRPISVGPRRGYRVRHAYTMGKSGEPLSVTQVATLLVLDGRAVTVLAYGRTELFHPLADAIERLMNDMSVGEGVPQGGAPPIVVQPPVTPAPVTPTPVTPTPVSPTPVTPTPVTPEPVDLGTLGGKK